MGMKAGDPERAADAVPTDWGTWTVGRHAKIITGPFGTLLKASEYSSNGEGVPVISVGEIREGYFRVGSHTPRVAETVTRRLPQFVLRAGDVVFGRKGSVERSALVGPTEAGWFLGSDGISVRPTDGIDPRYLAYQFQSATVKSWVLQQATGTTMATLNQRILGAVSVPVPPTTAEQEAIAEALSDADALIETLEQLIAKKRLIKQGVMQELLTGKRRLPGFEEEWATKELRELTRATAGGTPSTAVSDYWGGSIPWMASGELHQKRVVDVVGRITESGLANSSASLIPEKCVLIGLAGQGKTRGTVAINEVPLTTNQSIAAVLPCTQLVPDYLFHNLDARYTELRELSAGDGGRGGLNLTLIGKLEVPVPPVEEQLAIANVLNDLDADLNSLDARLLKSRQIKQGMMQQLLTGRIRLT